MVAGTTATQRPNEDVYKDLLTFLWETTPEPPQTAEAALRELRDLKAFIELKATIVGLSLALCLYRHQPAYAEQLLEVIEAEDAKTAQQIGAEKEWEEVPAENIARAFLQSVPLYQRDEEEDPT